MTSRSRGLLLARHVAPMHRKLETEDPMVMCEVAHHLLEDELQGATETEIDRSIDRQALNATMIVDTVGAEVAVETEVVGGAKAKEESDLLTTEVLRAGR